jgi:hypothetical protein
MQRFGNFSTKVPGIGGGGLISLHAGGCNQQAPGCTGQPVTLMLCSVAVGGGTIS